MNCEPISLGNRLVEWRFRFHKWNLEEGETVIQYVAALKRLSEYCDFRAYLEEVLRDRLICGGKSEATQKWLLMEAALIFHKAVEIAISVETVAREAQQLRCGKYNHTDDDCWYKDQDFCNCGPHRAIV